MHLPEVILVDENDQQTGVMEKLEAHRKGLLHRAFSVFILNSEGEMLLQKRALNKYHSPGLWTNTCCSHPMPGELTIDAASRRLMEEMGFSCHLKEIESFKYHAPFDNGLIEHEYDHILIGHHNGEVLPDPEEVCEHQWLYLDDIEDQLKINKDAFTFWFRIAFPLVKNHLTL